MAAQALAAAAVVLSFAVHGNRIELQLDRGSAELVWVGEGAFRFRRTLDGPLPEAATPDRGPVQVRVDDTPGAVVMHTRLIEVSIRKRGVLPRVRRANGAPLAADVSEPRESEHGFIWERQAPAGSRFYGLGARPDPVLDLNGRAVTAGTSLLVCSAGYGEYHPGDGPFRFDFTSAESYRIEAPRIDYYFYYGPTPKDVFEKHHAVRAEPATLHASTERVGSWAALRSSLLTLVGGAMSAELAPLFNLAAYVNAPAELLARARQLGSLVPEVRTGAVALSEFRRQLQAFYNVYAVETSDRGYPVWHPLPFQFPDDPECALHADEFMLGDEMLVAPIYEPGGKRWLYLPRGIWTNLETNEVFEGRRTIAVATPALPVFARSGAIVPLDSLAGMALHYFPKLGAEFFLLEADIGAYSQVHAAPADDLIRLEIESKKDRDYQWVVHHVERPASVGFEGSRYEEAPAADRMADRTWYYDAARKNLHVRVSVKAGEDRIVNIAF
jgi:hypothetical protein